MLAGTVDPRKVRLLGAGAVLLLGLGHAAHAAHDGDSLVRALLPTVAIALQVALLSTGQGWAERRKWSFATAALAAITVSLACGVGIVGLHAGRPDITAGALVAASASAGLGVLAFWLLAVYFPVQLSLARARVLAVEGARQKAELARLRSNLHPHFLLNTLNAVAGLLVADPRQARQLVIALGDLLRDSLEDEGAMRSFGEEVEWLRRYAQNLRNPSRWCHSFRMGRVGRQLGNQDPPLAPAASCGERRAPTLSRPSRERWYGP
jgi:hypothetical protein